MDAYQELITQIKGKTIGYILANKNSNNGFDIIFTDDTALELYAVDSKLGWVYNADCSNNTIAKINFD